MSKHTYNINYDRDIDTFRKKVVVVNDQIEEGIDHLQRMISDLKNKKLQQSMAKSKL